MPQTGYTSIQLYNSSTPGATPSSANLTTGELAVNIADGKLFYKDSGGSVQQLNGDVTLTGTQTLTNKTISADDNTLSGVAASSFVLSNASGNIDGSATQKAIPSGAVVGTTDTQTLTNKTMSTGSTWSGTAIPVANGGTGATSASGARSNLSAAASGAVTSSGLTMSTGVMLGRSTASTGAIQEITVGSGLSLSAGTLSATAGGGGTVTSVSAGNGMNFTTITGSGSVTLGTPGTCSGSTSNAVTSTSHTHTLSSASAATGGIVNTTTQTFAGVKTFNAGVIVSSAGSGFGSASPDSSWNAYFKSSSSTQPSLVVASGGATSVPQRIIENGGSTIRGGR